MPHDCYKVLYLLKPNREVEPDWWSLRWRPIWRETVSAYIENNLHRWSIGTFGLGFKMYRSDAYNGWGRRWKHWTIALNIAWWTAHLWVRWGFVVHRSGPLDQQPREPINVGGAT